MQKLKRENEKIICAHCGLNPNYSQSKEQQKWERDYIIKHGKCNACDNEDN